MNPGRSIAKERRLIHIPIIHTLAEMGALGAPIQRAKESALGRQVQARNVALVEQWWDRIERIVTDLPVTPGKVRLYQDGLPVCGHEQEIVAELAEAGHRNYRLLMSLQARGAVLMGTESPELLTEEYQLAKAMLSRGNPAPSSSRPAQARDTLLERRDRFVADRIDRTLGVHETGILLMGMLHSVTRYLNGEIEVIHPLPALL